MATHPRQGGASAPSKIVPIRRRGKVPKANRPEDSDTITRRRMLDRAIALADTEKAQIVIAAVWGGLPANNLRCLAGTLDLHLDLKLRLAEVRAARARAEVMSAEIDRVRTLHGDDAADAMFGVYHRLWDHYRQAMADMARSPARTKHELERKRSTIGKTWLGCEGEWYDQLRAGIAADEAWLAEHAPTKRRRG